MWRDAIPKVKASFRGVEFATVDADARIGRRNVTHEYPQRDEPYAEDLGRRARQFVVDAYVLGDDYLEKRDALIDAIEQPGPGELVHPRWGTMQVVVLDSVSVRESPREGGIARFSITFGEAGQNTFPKATQDTVLQLDAAAFDLEDDLEAQFATDFSVAGSSVLEQGALEWITAGLGELQAIVRRVADVAAAGDIVRQISALSSALTEVIRSPAMLVRTLRGTYAALTLSSVRPLGGFNDLQNTFIASPRPTNLNTELPGSTRARLSTNRAAYADMQRRLSVAYQARFLALSLQPPAGPTSASVRSAAVRAAAGGQLVTGAVLVSAGGQIVTSGSAAVGSSGSAAAGSSGSAAAGSSAAAAALVPAEPPIATVTQALQLRDRLLAQIDTELEDNDPPPAVASSLVALRRAVTRDVQERVQLLRRVSTFTPAVVLPSLFLAQRLYQDARRAEELEQRNGVRHAAFVPAQPLEVLQ